MTKKKFNVRGMTCASCQAHVQKAVEKLDGTANVNVNLLQNTLTLDYDESVCSVKTIEDAVSDAGYSASPAGEEEKVRDKNGNTLGSLLFCMADLLLIMYFSMGHMMWNWPVPPVFDMHTNPMGFSLIQFILVLPILLVYRNYFVNGWKRLFKRSPNMDTLIAVGATASVLYGIYSLFMISMGHTEYHMYLYFEAAGMILTLVSLGKYLEGMSKKNTTKALEKLMDMSPKEALVEKDGNIVRIRVQDLHAGDILIAKRGDIIAADGAVIEGQATVNEANITGESMPCEKAEGSKVYSSTVIESGYIRIRAEKVGEDTSFAAILRLVDEASSSKAPISRLADRISAIFVPAILSIAFLTFLVNFIVSGDFELALNFGITVVVIACPCALGLATPVSIMAGTGKGASCGILIKNAEILEKAHTVKTIVFDKTGTITKGKPAVTDYIEFEKGYDSQLKSLENNSEHPLAKAIHDYLKNGSYLPVTGYQSVDGKGITGCVDDIPYFVGNRKLATDYCPPDKSVEETFNALSGEGKTVLIFGTKGKIISLIALEDEIKENSKDAITLLKKMGIRTIMLTGDNQRVAKNVALKTGIDDVISDVLPQEKQAVITKLKQETGNTVAMVGDGVNDAPALAASDLGIAIGAGSDVAIETADIVLLRNDLMDVVNSVRLSRKVMRTIRIGLFWAFFYNAVCVLLSTGFLYYLTSGNFKMTPMIGSAAMSISSVSVVLNALTINFFRPIRKEGQHPAVVSDIQEKEITIDVEGMMCEHCQAHVQNACLSVPGVLSARADLEKKNVTLTYAGNLDRKAVVQSIEKAGYKAK